MVPQIIFFVARLLFISMTKQQQCCPSEEEEEGWGGLAFCEDGTDVLWRREEEAEGSWAEGHLRA